MSSYNIIFSRISKLSLYLAVFLIPLFFLPLSQNILSQPKQILLLFLVFLSLISWLIKQQIQGKIILRGNKLFYLILVFLVFIFFLSAIFSLWPSSSFWGVPLSISDNFVSFLSFVLFAFLLANVFDAEKEIFLAALLLLISGLTAGIFLLFQLYGFFLLPFDFTQISSFNTIGSVYQAAIFLAILLPLALVLAFQVKKPLFWFILAVLSISIILIDFTDAWIVLLFGILIIAIFSLSDPQKKIRPGLAAFLMALLVLSIFFIFFPLRFVGFPALPLQVSPGLISDFEILRGVYSQGAKEIVLGSGPGTFIFDYSRHRSPLLNQTIFWGTRFSSASSEFLSWFITKGFLAGISLICFVALLVYFSAKEGLLAKREGFSGIRLGLTASAVTLFAAGFLSSFNFSLWFIFWFIFGSLLFYSSEKKETGLDLQLPSRKLFFSVLTLVLMISGFVLFIFQGQKYLAEISYSKGINLSGQGDLDQAIVLIQRATMLNPSVDTYWRDLAQLYLARANLIAQDQAIPAEEKRQLVHETISNGVQSLNQSIGYSPFNVANWNVRGFFYRSLIGIPGAGEIALESYARAAELETASPFPYGEMGRVYILMAQDFKGQQMEEQEKDSLFLAISNLEKSIELKTDYAPAHYLLAIAYDQQGKQEEAIARLEEIKSIAYQDIGIFFQLGMLYWRKGQLEQAQAEFEQIIRMDSDYSNARYMLGLIYDKKGEKEKAIIEFEKVAQLNPDNQEVQDILANLKKDLPALEGIIVSFPPIEEMPPEIQE